MVMFAHNIKKTLRRITTRSKFALAVRANRMQARGFGADFYRRTRGELDNAQHALGPTTSVGEDCIGSRSRCNVPAAANPLSEYFDARVEGRGIWKWRHYFDIYHRHFQKFVGQEVHIVEIGIYSGGSLDMWKSYFGDKCHVHGVDIEEACRSYESDSVSVHIGDQQDRTFWKQFRKDVPRVDIVLDDGGHKPEQQIVSLEELLPHVRPGGVYVCEDVHGVSNDFASYVYGLSRHLNATTDFKANKEDPERRSVCKADDFQRHVHSVHLYPYVVAIERHETPMEELVAPKHGTQWQPFLT